MRPVDVLVGLILLIILFVVIRYSAEFSWGGTTYTEEGAYSYECRLECSSAFEKCYNLASLENKECAKPFNWWNFIENVRCDRVLNKKVSECNKKYNECFEKCKIA